MQPNCQGPEMSSKSNHHRKLTIPPQKIRRLISRYWARGSRCTEGQDKVADALDFPQDEGPWKCCQVSPRLSNARPQGGRVDIAISDIYSATWYPTRTIITADTLTTLPNMYGGFVTMIDASNASLRINYTLRF